MKTIDTSGLPNVVVRKTAPMLDDMLREHASNIHSIHIVGSAVIPDYDEKVSDINSLVLLRDMDLRFLSFLAPLGKKYGKHRIAAPLVMTPEYVRTSLDAFPVEFLDFKLIHRTVHGPDILRDLQIEKPALRLQCERDVKTKLIGLRQGYLSSLGKKEHLAAALVRSITGSMALFRAIIFLLGAEPPMPRSEVLKQFAAAMSIETDVFASLLALKAHAVKPSEPELHSLFERYYSALESVGRSLDELSVH